MTFLHRLRDGWLNFHRRPLPLRLWLVLAGAAVIGAGFVAQMGLTAAFVIWDQQAESARLASVRQIIGTQATSWQDPSWQRQAEASLDALNTEVAVFGEQSGTLVYATAAARSLLSVDTAGTSATPTSAVSENAVDAGGSGQTLPEFQRIVINNVMGTTADHATDVAFLWFTAAPPGEPSSALWPGVELGTFAITLALVVWLVGWPVLRPLAEMSRAAESIAGGDLTIHLPLSPVREIAEVSAALEGTSAALSESLSRQVALEEERRLFVGAAAHDLRTPLFMLRGYLKGLERGVAETPEKVAHYIAMSIEKADALERLIADLFAYTRLDRPEQEPDWEPVDLGALLRNEVEGVASLATRLGITLAIDGPEGPCIVLGDKHLLARSIVNLLDNALRYAGDGGTVQVRWRRNGGEVTFSVEDSGPGIDPRDLPYIFTPLYRGKASSARSGGAGLGLAISQRVLRAHGGDLVAANATAHGAILNGTLPAKRHADPPMMPDASAVRLGT